MKHPYRLEDGTLIRSVSQVIAEVSQREALSWPGRFWIPSGPADRGTRIHASIEKDTDKGD